MKNEKTVTSTKETSELEKLAEEISTQKFVAVSTNGKKSIYKLSGVTAKEQKTERRKLRAKVENLLCEIARKNQSFSKTKKVSESSLSDIEEFKKLYKEKFIINDFSLESVREKIENLELISRYKFALLIVQSTLTK